VKDAGQGDRADAWSGQAMGTRTLIGRQPGAPKASGSVLSGTGLMLASRVVVAVLGWVGTILVARNLSESDWGAYSYVFNLLGVLGLLADLQISRIVMVELIDAEDDLEPVVGRYVALRFVLALVSYLLAFGIVVVSGKPSEVVVATLVAGLSFFMASTLWAIVTVCQIKFWLRPVAMGLALGQVVQLALTLVLYVTDRGTIVRYAVPAVLYDLTAMVFVLVAVRGAVRVRPRVDLARWWVWLKAAVPLALGSSLATLYFRIDSLMLAELDGLTAVGRYQYGYKFSDILAFVASALLGVVLPLLVRGWSNRPADFHRVFRLTFVLLVVAGAAAAASFAVIAAPALATLFGAPASAATPARVLVAGQVLNFFSQLGAITLIATGRHRIYPFAALVGVVVNVALNFALIPAWSATGAGIATVITEVLVIAVMATVVVRIPGVRPFPWRAVRVSVVGAAAMAIAIAFLLGVVPWPLALAAGAPVYLFVLHALDVDGPGGLRRLVHDSRVDLKATA
jgi:O-antigen/teichoic acid export membrane protein